MKDFPIPVVAFGAGAAALEPGFTYVPMPAAEPLPRPMPPENASAEDLAAAAAVVERFLAAMADGAFDQGRSRLSVAGLAPRALRALNESLGHGEVSAIVALPDGMAWRIQETAFCGIWRLRLAGADGEPRMDLLEGNDIPEVLKAAARQARGARLDAAALPEGVMNAPAVVHEIREHARRVAPGRAAHVINLSLLPFNAADHRGLQALLGAGDVTILSRGFGNCRIASTAAAGVWRVQYFNSMSTLILDTLEVVDIPEAALAAAEDFSASIERLEELVAWLRAG